LYWGAFHIGEDEKELHEKLEMHIDKLLAFINPQQFKEYFRRKESKEIVNETFDEEIKSRLGITKEQAYSYASQNEEMPAETVEPDVFGEPIIVGDIKSNA
jgi:hypothetical protein